MFCIRRYGSASLSGAWIACSLCSCWMQSSPRNDRNTEHLLTTDGIMLCWNVEAILVYLRYTNTTFSANVQRFIIGHTNVGKDIDRFEAMNAVRVPTAQCAACGSLFWKTWTSWVMVVLYWQPSAGMEINILQIMLADNTASRAPTCWQVPRAVERWCWKFKDSKPSTYRPTDCTRLCQSYQFCCWEVFEFWIDQDQHFLCIKTILIP